MIRSSPLTRRPGFRAFAVPILLGAALSVFTSACSSEQEPPSDEARLTNRGAGDLLTSDAETVTAGFEDLTRPPPTAPLPEEITLEMLGVDYGAQDAPVRIFELFDFGCGFCRKFHTETFPALAEKYIDEGKLLWKAIPFVIGNWANSVPATLAAECALGQGREQYNRMADALFDRQSDWKQASEPEPVLDDIASEAGLDMEVFRVCMADDKFLWRVQAHSSVAQQMSVRGTPTFVVVGYTPFSGALPLELFEQIIDTVLVNATRGAP